MFVNGRESGRDRERLIIIFFLNGLDPPGAIVGNLYSFQWSLRETFDSMKCRVEWNGRNPFEKGGDYAALAWRCSGY